MRSTIVARALLDEPMIERLVAGTLDGQKRARDGLWSALWPVIETIAGRWRVTGRISGREDERRDIVSLVMAELLADDFALLRELHEDLRRRDGSFQRKLSTIAMHTAIDYTRAHSEYQEGAGAGGSNWPKRTAVPPDRLEAGDLDAVHRVAVREILDFADRHLRGIQREAFALWFAGENDEEIAETLGLAGAAAAGRLMGAVRKGLRRHLSPKQDGVQAPEDKSTGPCPEIRKRSPCKR